MAKAAAKKSKKALTKSALFADLAEKTELTKKQIEAVFDHLTAVIVQQLSSKGPQAFTIPGLFKLKAIPKKAVKGGEVKQNPLKPGETYVTKDKPAHVKVTARPLKSLKEALAPAPK
jgi:nucleoid DNA-binding protein